MTLSTPAFIMGVLVVYGMLLTILKRFRRENFTNPEVIERMTMRNVGSLYYISLIVMVFECLMLTIFRIVARLIPECFTLSYRILYTILFLFGLITFLITRNRRKKRSLTEKEVRFFRRYSVAFSFILFLWGCVVTILDLQSYYMVITFIINYVLCTTFILIQPITYLIIEIPPMLILFSFIHYKYPSTFLMYMINLSILFVCVTLNSFQTYCHVYRNEQSLLRLKDVSEKDELSRLNNRRKLRDYIDIHILKMIRNIRSIGMIMIDIDHFKDYNDCYGHPKGDIVITKIGALLNRVVDQHNGFCARYGGEEFLVIIKNKSMTELTQISNEIRDGVAGLKIEHATSDVVPYVSVSIGQYYDGKVGKSFKPSRAIEQADHALYHAKENGRNQICQNHN